MNRAEFLENLEKFNILKFGNFTLASGLQSEFYLDLRIIPYETEFFAHIMKEFSDQLISKVNFDIVCGIPMAGIPFATLIAFFTKKPLIFIRKIPKDHGLKKLIEGGNVNEKNVLIIDDLISSGFSKEFAIEELRKEGATVTALAVIVDRREQNNLSLDWENKQRIKVHSFIQLSSEDILEYRKGKK
jgi:orotate phosphoribosyltransferase